MNASYNWYWVPHSYLVVAFPNTFDDNRQPWFLYDEQFFLGFFAVWDLVDRANGDLEGDLLEPAIDMDHYELER